MKPLVDNSLPTLGFDGSEVLPHGDSVMLQCLAGHLLHSTSSIISGSIELTCDNGNITPEETYYCINGKIKTIVGYLY